MKDPRRLLEGDASELELRLLTLAQREQAPNEAPRRLAAQLGIPVGALGLASLGSGAQPIGAASAAPPAAATVSAGTGLLQGAAGKLIVAGLLGALGGGALVAVMMDTKTRAPEATATAASASAPKAESPATSSSSTPLASPSVPSKATAAAVSGEAGKLDREVARLAAVRAAIQSGKVEEALVGLRAFEREHPASVLSQEAHALRIEALLAARDTQAAEAEGERFLRRHPDSPHRARVQALLRAARSLR